jgi:hypothetical protein
LALVILLLSRMLSESALLNPGLDIATFLHLATFTALLVFSGQEGPNSSVGSDSPTSQGAMNSMANEV